MPLRLRLTAAFRRPWEMPDGDGEAPSAERSFEFADDIAQIRIGRRENLELTLPFTALSSVHARLVRSDGGRGWLLEDLGSRNGTFLGGKRLAPGEKRSLVAGAEISLGHVRIVFEGRPVTGEGAGPGEGATGDGKAEQVQPAPHPSPLPASGERGQEGRAAGQERRPAPLPGPLPASGERGQEGWAAGQERRPAPLPGPLPGSLPASGERGQEAGEERREASRSGSSAGGERGREAGTGTIARRLVSGLFAGAPTNIPTLNVIAGAPGGGIFRLAERNRRYVFGRVRGCDFRVKVEEISREHAAFTRRDEGLFVSDLGSKNGLRVNGVRAREQRLQDGDLVQIGPVKLRVSDPEERYLRQMNARSSAGATPSPAVPAEAAAAEAPPPPAAAAPDPSTGRSPSQRDLHPLVAGAIDAGGSDENRPSIRQMLAAAPPPRRSARLPIVLAVAVLLAVGIAVVGFVVGG